MALFRNVILISFFCVSEYCNHVCTLDYENEQGPDYGENWIMFLDDNGTTHTLNFSSLPSDTRSMIFGDAYFYLYTRQNDHSEELIISDDNMVESKYFNSSRDVKILTHGWLSKETTEWLQKIKNSYLKKGDFNVIIVDWSELADNPVYPWSAFSTRYVGKRVAKLLKGLENSYKVEGENVHLIGHSLGAQVMGYAGMFYDRKVHRITGLDPARPLFELPLMGPDFRLDSSDAFFVDIIHTCGGVYGYRLSHGDADFYPNNGKPRQPGCKGAQQMIEGCSHGRSTEFYEESISSDVPFKAYPCESWQKFNKGECTKDPVYMGYSLSTNSSGDYYLHTRAEPKYAIEEDSCQ